MNDHPKHIELDVSALPLDQQFAAWAVTQHPFKSSQPAGSVGFAARARAWFVPPLVISESELPPFSTLRTIDNHADDGMDGITFQLFLHGGMHGVADGRPFTVTAGQIAIQDASLPFAAQVTASHTVAISMPRTAIEERVEIGAHHGSVLMGSAAVMLTGIMRSLPAAMALDLETAAPELAAIVCSTLVAALAQMPKRADGDAGDKAVRAKARRYIAARLHRHIPVGELCAATGTSRSALYRAFRKDFGVAAYVKKRRLYKIRQMLADQTERRPIATLAAIYGFAEPSYFNREFRNVFGTTPGAIRRGARSVNAGAGLTTQEAFLDWIATSEQR